MDGKYTRPQLDALCINLQIQDLLDFESTTIDDYFTLYSFPFLKIFLTETWSVIMSWAHPAFGNSTKHVNKYHLLLISWLAHGNFPFPLPLATNQTVRHFFRSITFFLVKGEFFNEF